MNWPYEDSAYQVAAVEGLAVFYGVHADGMSLRGQSFDLTDDELDQSLRVGGFRLTDVAATPDGQTAFIGDFVAANGSRQLVGLDLIAVEVEQPRPKRGAEASSVLSRALDSALRGGFRHRSDAEEDLQEAAPEMLLADSESVGTLRVDAARVDAGGSDAEVNVVERSLPAGLRRAADALGERSVEGGACPYLRKRDAVAGAAIPVEPAGSESAAAREYRCAQAQGMLVMTVARLERLCQDGGYTECRHYRYAEQRELQTAGTPLA